MSYSSPGRPLGSRDADGLTPVDIELRVRLRLAAAHESGSLGWQDDPLTV
jgi:hypothetical protein